MPGPDPIEPTNYSQIAEIAQAAVGRLSSLGVSHVGTRFERYVAYLAEALRRTYPRAVHWTEHRSGLIYELEAIGQCIQLAAALTLRDCVDRDALTERLVKVVRGPELPPDADDHARNLLHELTTAALLRGQAFKIDLPAAGREDLRVRVGGATLLPVECKRPASEGSIKTSVRKARAQLYRRGYRYGLVSIGVDRVVGISGDLPRVESRNSIPSAVLEGLRHCADVVAEVGAPQPGRLVPVAITVMAGAVFSDDPVQPVIVLRMGWSHLPGADRPLARRLMAAFTPGPFMSPKELLEILSRD